MTPARLELTLEGRPGDVATARTFAFNVACAVGFSDRAAEDLRLAVSEMVTAAIETEVTPVVVTALLDGAVLEVSVSANPVTAEQVRQRVPFERLGFETLALEGTLGIRAIRTRDAIDRARSRT